MSVTVCAVARQAVVALGDATLAPQRCIELAHRVGNWFTGTSLIFRRSALEGIGVDAPYLLPGVIPELQVCDLLRREPQPRRQEHIGEVRQVRVEAQRVDVPHAFPASQEVHEPATDAEGLHADGEVLGEARFERVDVVSVEPEPCPAIPT